MTEMTSATKAWLDGVKSFEAGCKTNQNPYDEPELSEKWLSGYEDAKIIIGDYSVVDGKLVRQKQDVGGFW